MPRVEMRVLRYTGPESVSWYRCDAIKHIIVADEIEGPVSIDLLQLTSNSPAEPDPVPTHDENVECIRILGWNPERLAC